MASTKRETPVAQSEEPEAKKVKVSEEAESSEPPKGKQRVVLNLADCDLDFNMEGNGLQGSALHEQGFTYCWSGARANMGIAGGKYCFGCKIISAQPVDMEDTPPDQQHVCRLGISRGDDSVGNLGETDHSFGFGGTGKFSNAGKFSDYGEKFGVGDTIVCSVNLESKPLASIGFSKNGKWLGIAKHFNAGSNGLGVVDSPIRKLQWESALFPHVLLKNVVVEVQFSPEDGLIPEEGYKPWASALEDGNAIMGPSFPNSRDCEVIMMVGLPASGKSTWAEKWVKEHPEKRYVLLGTNLALDQMKVPGLLRKHNYGERFDRLMDRATGIFNTLLNRAAKTPRNFIIDQTNVYKSARKRKLKPFANYRKVAVVVFPKPEELKSRASKRFKEMGKEVPAEAVNEMLANYILPLRKDMPGADECFDQVIFTELNREEAQRYLDDMKYTLASGANMSPKSISPYCRESSVQSHKSSSMQSQETYSECFPYGSARGGYWQSSYSPRPQFHYDYPRPDLENCAYFGASGANMSPKSISPYCHESSVQSHKSSSMQSQETFSARGGHWQSSYSPRPQFHYDYQRPDLGNSAYFGGRSPARLDSPSVAHQTNPTPNAPNAPYGNYGGYAYPHRGDFEGRSVNPGVGTDPYRAYGVGPYSHPNVGSSSLISDGATGPYRSVMVESYARQPYGSNAEHTDFFWPVCSQPDLRARRESTFMPAPATTYDSPHGSHIPRPVYGNPPPDMLPRGYVPPRSRYY